MDEGNNFSSEFDAFIKALNEAKLQRKATTLPEVFGIQFKEVYITKWIAYFLGHHILGIKMLNALLNINDQNIAITRIEKVYTEYIFPDGRRIDILIFADNYLIGIENKIWSGEQENQTNDYIQSMKKLSSGKETIGVYLHPEENKTESVEFNNVTYQQFLNALLSDNSVSYAEIDQFTYHLYEEFKRYIKECLCMNNGEFSELSPNVMLYAEHYSMINEVKNEYEAASAKILEWIVYKLDQNGYKALHEPYRGYLQVAKNPEWEKIGFHFELLWSQDFIVNGKIIVDVHLENIKGENKTNLRKHFDLHDEKSRGPGKPLAHKEITNCNFTTEAKANTIIDTILQILRSPEFEELANKAELYLKSDYYQNMKGDF